MKRASLILFISFLLSTNLLGQNVGIGTVNPQSKLQINHRSSVAPGLKLLDSATNLGGVIEFQNISFTRGMKVAGYSSSNFNNAQYLDFRSDSITTMTVRGNGFVGIRNLEPSYPLDVSGDMNVTGLIRTNGSAGLAGQVLTSNGSADPAWKNAALTNTTRFAASFIGIFPSGPAGLTYTTIYNVNPPDITIGTNSITINKPGLYHIEGYLTSEVIFITAPSAVFANFSLNLGGSVFEYGSFEPYNATNSAVQFKKTIRFSQDFHFSAPATISPNLGVGSIGGLSVVSRTETGKITGYLIAE
jgi:hypothetical protein